MLTSLMQNILQLIKGNKSNLLTFISHFCAWVLFTLKISDGTKIIFILNNEKKVLLESHLKGLAVGSQRNRIHFNIAKCKIIYTGIKDVDSTYKVEDSALKNSDSRKFFGFKG